MRTFILWSEHFDEEFAVTFVCRLREAGLAVTVVGLRGRQAFGSVGLGLCCDATLGEAFAAVTTCAAVVIPGHTPYLQSLELDPRVANFLAVAYAHHALLVAGQVDPANAQLFPCALHRLLICPKHSDYGLAAQQLIQSLQARH